MAAAWEDGEDEIARTVDLERKKFDTVKVIERATKQEVGHWSIWKLGQRDESQNIYCNCIGARSAYTLAACLKLTRCGRCSKTA